MMEWHLYRGTDIPHKLIFGLILYNQYQWRTEGSLGCSKHPEIPKALLNLAKLNPIVKTVKNCYIMMPTPQDVRENGSKILKLPGYQLVYISNDKYIVCHHKYS